MNIPAYCSINFIDQIIKDNSIDFITPENIAFQRSNLELIELIIDGLLIKTDCSSIALEKKWSNPIYKHLMKNNRLFSAENEFKKLIFNETEFFQLIKEPTCLFLLSEFDNAKLNNLSEYSGNYFLSLERDFSNLFDQRIESFSKNKVISWEFVKNFIDAHHSIVIADPYLFTYASRLNYEKFFKKISPKNLNNKYHISLIGKDRESLRNKTIGTNLSDISEIRNWVQTLNETLKNTIVEFHVYNEGEFHDRLIITNNTIITSGIGFSMLNNNMSNKDSTWIGFKPYKKIYSNNNSKVFVYKIMKEKLRSMKFWISTCNQKITNNPLLTT